MKYNSDAQSPDSLTSHNNFFYAILPQIVYILFSYLATLFYFLLN